MLQVFQEVGGTPITESAMAAPQAVVPPIPLETLAIVQRFWIVGSIGCVGLAFGLDMKALGIWIRLAVTLFVLAALPCARLHGLVRST